MKKFFLILLLCIFSKVNYIHSKDTTYIFLISPMTSPISTLVKFQPLADYLSRRMNKTIQLKQRKTYKEINELLKENRAHFAYVCTGGYLRGRKDFGLELLAIPVIENKKTYRAYIIVHKDSPFRTVEDLQGTLFAYTDPLSLTGHLYVKYYLRERGREAKDFFRKTFFTGSHEKSIEAVALKLADAASVDSLVFEEWEKKRNPLIKEVRIIHASYEFGMPPIVVASSFPKEEKLKLLKILLNMHKDPEGKKILQQMGIERFDPPDHSLYKMANHIVNTMSP